MRKFLLIIPVILCFSKPVLSQTGISVDCQDNWGAGRYNKVTVTIQFDQTGFARFTQDFPEGFDAVIDDQGGGDVCWTGNQLNAVFMRVGAGQTIRFVYYIIPGKSIYGTITIQGKLVIISGGIARSVVKLKERPVDIGDTGGLLQPEINNSPIRITGPDSKVMPVFRVQVYASSKSIPVDKLREEFSLEENIKVSVMRVGNTYKYQAGEYPDFDSAAKLLRRLRDKGIKDAFIVTR